MVNWQVLSMDSSCGEEQEPREHPIIYLLRHYLRAGRLEVPRGKVPENLQDRGLENHLTRLYSITS